MTGEKIRFSKKKEKKSKERLERKETRRLERQYASHLSKATFVVLQKTGATRAVKKVKVHVPRSDRVFVVEIPVGLSNGQSFLAEIPVELRNPNYKNGLIAVTVPSALKGG